MSAMLPDYIIVCPKIGFLLPIFGSALKKSDRRIGFAKKRYEGALLINPNMGVSEILQIELADTSALGRMRGSLGLGHVDVVVGLSEIAFDWESALREVAKCAISPRSSSVWGYYYDSLNELEVAISESQDFEDLATSLYATEPGAIAEALM